MIQRFARARQAEIGLGFIRIVAGVIFAAHGYQKWFVMGMEGTTAFFTGLGIPMPGIMAMLVGTLELAGGIALALGLVTRWVAIPLAIDMAVAIITFHGKNGFFVPRGIEFVTLLMTAAIALAIGGPGAFAVDGMSRRRTDGSR